MKPDQPFILQGLSWRAWVNVALYAEYKDALLHLQRIRKSGVMTAKERRMHTFRIVEVRAEL